MVICLLNKRDDFSDKTKALLANRVCGRCSNPDCRKPTLGANTDPNKPTNIGVAAHICAAASGGPRYDENMTPKERKSPQNGIWLCQSCAKLIDADPLKYTKEMIIAWKTLAETTSALELAHSFESNNTNILETHPNRWFVKSEKHASFSWFHNEVDKFCKVTEGSIILISGLTGVGIDMFVQNVIRHNLKADSKVIYFNLKESSTTIVNSMISPECCVKTSAIRTGTLTADEWNRIAETATALEKASLILEPYNSNGISMVPYFLSAIRNGNSDIVVLDDLDGLCIDSTASLNSFMYELRNAAIQSGAIVFILVDFNETHKRMDKRPLLTDEPINKLMKFCDVIQFLHYDDSDDYLLPMAESKTLELIVVKNYSLSHSGMFYVAQHPEYSKIVECEQPDKRKGLLEKYPGAVAGVEAILDCLKKL